MVRTVLRCLLVATTIAAMGTAQHVGFKCHILSEERNRIIHLVERRFALPESAGLSVIEEGEGLPGFDIVTVVSTRPGYPFEKQFVISKDGRYVLDLIGSVSVGAEEAEVREAREIAERLSKDDSPRLGAIVPKTIVVAYLDFQCGFCRDAAALLRGRVATDKGLQLGLNIIRYQVMIGRVLRQGMECVYMHRATNSSGTLVNSCSTTKHPSVP